MGTGATEAARLPVETSERRNGCCMCSARPIGRVLPGNRPSTRSLSEFQSSPAPEGRRYQRGGAFASLFFCFNPRLPRRAGATECDMKLKMTIDVSILACPGGQALPDRKTYSLVYGCFNPRLPRRAGATPAPPPWRPAAWCFNPRLPRRAGATLKNPSNRPT